MGKCTINPRNHLKDYDCITYQTLVNVGAKMSLSVSVNILTWNSKRYLEDCLDSVLSQTYPNVEILVIDNASQDGSIEMVKKKFPKIKIIENKKNLGYSGGHNKGIKNSKSDLVLCLNPDIILEKDFIKNLVSVFIKDRKVCAAGGKMFQHNFKNNKKSNIIDSTGLQILKNRWARDRGQGENYIGQYENEEEVFGVSGAAVMYRREALEDTKILGEYFDEDFFAYYEDLDLSWRLRLFGWKCLYAPKAIAYHGRLAKGGKPKENLWSFLKRRRSIPSFAKQLSYKNRHLMIIKNEANSDVLQSFSVIFWGEIQRFLYTLLFEPSTFFSIIPFIKQIPKVLEKRKIIMKRKKVSAQEIREWFSKKVEKSKIRIGMDARFYGGGDGGLGRYPKELIKNLLKIDHKNKYFLFTKPSRIKETHQDVKNFKNARAIETDIPHYSLKEQLKLPSIINNANIELMHFTNFNHPIMLKEKSIITIHDLTYHLFPARKESLINRIAYSLVIRDVKRAEKVIVVSENTKKDLINLLRIPEEKIKVIYEAANKNYRQIKNKQALVNIKKKYKINKPFLLHIGNWRKHKNVVRLIQAFAKFKERTNQHQLVLIGKRDPAFSEVIEIIERLNQKTDVSILEDVPDSDLPLLYNAADLFVFPSLYEGFGLPVVEAMQCGCPVITSNTSSLPEVGGDAVYYVNPYSVDEIADAIETVLNDGRLRRKMVQRGLKQAKKFSWEKCARETIKVYDEVMK